MTNSTYFKLAVWDAKSFTFRDGKRGFDTEADARAAANKPGQYRISTISQSGRSDGLPFSVDGLARPLARKVIVAGGLKLRPGPWHRGPQ